MDDIHREGGREPTDHPPDDDPGLRPQEDDKDMEPQKETGEEEKGEDRMEEETVAGQELKEHGAGDHEEDMEEDEPEGLKKSLKRSFKAVKHFFSGSGDQRRGSDPQSTFQDEAPLPQAPPEPDQADEEEYNFSHPKRGRAIIINNEKFHLRSSFDSRPGSKCDENSLKEMFKRLGFDVKCYNDLTALEIKQALETEARLYDHSRADCLAVAVLSHGDSEVVEKAWSYHQQHKAHQHHDKVRRDLVFGVDGSHISTASIIRTFQDERCPGLQGKPRLFFFQACRGDDYDDGVKVHVFREAAAAHDPDSKDYAGELEETDIGGFHLPRRRHIISPAPIFKDFLVMYATTPGHFAWRRSSGTWFIQSLHKVFVEQLTRHMTLSQALTRVSRMVAHGYQSQGNVSGKKQTPVIESMLTKDVYFLRK